MPRQIPLTLMVQYNLIQEAWNIGGLVLWTLTVLCHSLRKPTTGITPKLWFQSLLVHTACLFILESFGKHGACTGLNKMLTWKDFWCFIFTFLPPSFCSYWCLPESFCEPHVYLAVYFIGENQITMKNRNPWATWWKKTWWHGTFSFLFFSLR